MRGISAGVMLTGMVPLDGPAVARGLVSLPIAEMGRELSVGLATLAHVPRCISCGDCDAFRYQGWEVDSLPVKQ